MKPKLLLAASALALVAGLAFVALLMEMYDVTPDNWGPRGVEFKEWHKVWSGRRDLYLYATCGSFFAVAVFCVAGLFQRGGR